MNVCTHQPGGYGAANTPHRVWQEAGLQEVDPEAVAPQQVRQRYIAEDRPVRVVVEVPAVGVPIVGLDDQKPSARLQHPRYFAYYPGRRIRLEVLEHIRRKHDIEGGGGQRGKLAPDIQNPRLYSWSGMPADVRPDVGGDATRRSDRIDPVTMTG